MEKCYGDIKFVGKDTSMRLSWEVYADSYIALSEELLYRNIIHIDNWYEWYAKKLDVPVEDFYDENGEWDLDKYAGYIELYDDDYRDFIESCDGNAYYQYYSFWDELLDMYVDENINAEKYKELWVDKIVDDLESGKVFIEDLDKELEEDECIEIAERYLENRLNGTEFKNSYVGNFDKFYIADLEKLVSDYLAEQVGEEYDLE